MRQAHISHRTPGRLRVKVPEAKGNRELLEEIKFSVLPQEGVIGVDINPTTGSVLINYDPELHDGFDQRLTEHLNSEGLCSLSLTPGREMAGNVQSIEDVFKRLGEGIKRETHDTVDLREIFPLAIAAYDVFFVKRSRPTPMWLTLIMFAFSSYMDLHKGEPSRQVIEAVDALRAEVTALRADIHASAGFQH